ncbi:hypothetical protein K8I85_17180, partial [bacterium]|nr:hypothetical protein [bacterium]
MPVPTRLVFLVLLGAMLSSCTGGGSPDPIAVRTGTVMGTIAELKVVARAEADPEALLDAAMARL